MKLRNLLYATMVACAFASCSNDDDPIDNGGGNEVTTGDATLEVKVATPALTKAGEADKTITSLSVLVFDASTSKLEAIGTDDAGKAGVGSSVIAEGITAGAKKVFVLANAKEKVEAFVAGLKNDNATTLTAFFATTKDYANEVDGTLSMNSGVYDVNIQAGITNYLGYTEDQVAGYNGHYLSQAAGNAVKLYRNVAKVVLNKIQITADATKYKNATLDVEDVFILHANKTTKLVGANGDSWGTTVPDSYNYLNGASNGLYSDTWVKYMTDKTDKKVQNYLTGSNYENSIDFGWNLTQNINSSSAWEPKAYSYVYENTSKDIYTLLVVKGKFKYGDVQNPESRYYSVAIGKDGVAGIDNESFEYDVPSSFDGTRTGKLSGTVRNLQYNVDLKVAGPGYTTPFGPKAEDDTFLDVKVEVVNFGYVNQETEIE
ncbi:fimbrial protein [Parabacteroides sp. GYB001]|uniref:fimbrial protein n=1 Tax=Parabacteroides leei TaxID=2939491 RepID=UPI002018035F|nr:fimbrial protein [Parabacteroides leei]MCL3850513.1 fimbrial protein [Parabacteroides leei]